MDTTAVRFIGKLRGESNRGWQPFISPSYAAAAAAVLLPHSFTQKLFIVLPPQCVSQLLATCQLWFQAANLTFTLLAPQLHGIVYSINPCVHVATTLCNSTGLLLEVVPF